MCYTRNRMSSPSSIGGSTDAINPIVTEVIQPAIIPPPKVIQLATVPPPRSPVPALMHNEDALKAALAAVAGDTASPPSIKEAAKGPSGVSPPSTMATGPRVTP